MCKGNILLTEQFSEQINCHTVGHNTYFTSSWIGEQRFTARDCVNQSHPTNSNRRIMHVMHNLSEYYTILHSGCILTRISTLMCCRDIYGSHKEPSGKFKHLVVVSCNS